jgi:formate dehydrogenase subunit beta
LNSPAQLDRADPFAPLMVLNTAPHVLALHADHPRIGAVLRPCELRSLRELARIQCADVGGFLLISSDCLATFPREDFDWRVQHAADIEKITNEALHFASQGGILPSRLRPTCQACDHPFPVDADVHLAVLGMETNRHLVLGFRDVDLVHRLGFDSLPDPPVDLLTRRTRVLDKLTEWRQRSRAYAESHLEEDQTSLRDLVRHLRSCENCRTWISQACPFFGHAWEVSGSGQKVRELESAWLPSCGGCGMCDHACPDAYPLSTVIGFLARKAKAPAL